MPIESSRRGVIIENVVSLRSSADSKAEQTTQALLGQPVKVEAGQGEWLFVQTWDTYRAWIPARAVRILARDEDEYASLGPVAVIRELIADIFSEPHERSEIITKVTLSVEIEVIDPTNGWVELKLPDGRHGFIRKNEARLIDKDLTGTIPLPYPKKIIETAMRFIGTPYLWGGTSPFGIDCSGFIQLVHHIHGVTLLRDAYMQASDPRAERVTRDNLRAGDLVFFGKGTDPDFKSITHVGMMADSERFIHSCGSHGVIVTPINNPEYTRIFWGARRMRLETLDPGGGVSDDLLV
ncbi:MAG: NlpC/P60 family protein [Armatimonadota bacterium]|nr:C40 family peptidase [bacterium]